MKRVTYSKEAIKTLGRMPANVSALIRAKMEQYASDPKALANNVKALRGGDALYRLRVGDWRVVFAEDGTVVSVTKVAPRGSVYD